MICPPRANDVKKTWQLADAPLPDNLHGLPKKVPVTLLVKLTVPVGGDRPALAVSVTVAVQTVASPGANEPGEQRTLVAVACAVRSGLTAIPTGLVPAKKP